MTNADSKEEADIRLARQKLEVSEAMTAKLQAEARHIETQITYYPWAIGSGVVLAIVAVVKLFL
ncbi:MAG: hypothetical protein OXR62_11275 [Ahrensia sp.]|nr:hypothetical protein [Ahrensia sp.]